MAADLSGEPTRVRELSIVHPELVLFHPIATFERKYAIAERLNNEVWCRRTISVRMYKHYDAGQEHGIGGLFTRCVKTRHYLAVDILEYLADPAHMRDLNAHRLLRRPTAAIYRDDDHPDLIARVITA
jgi:hypothetical protein